MTAIAAEEIDRAESAGVAALLRLSTVLVAPISTSARSASFRPEIEIDGNTTRVLVEQTGAIDVGRLGDHHRRLSPEGVRLLGA